MVLGLKGKNRRGPSVQVEYIIHVQEIKPWPPTQSLKAVRSVLIQWDNGDRNSGSTSAVTPSTEDGKIEFNETFRIPVLLSRDMSIKNGDVDVFHKNLIEFNLYEPRRDKTVKGQLLGTAIVDLAEYGVITEMTNVSVPMNCTRSFRNTAQPVLYLRVQPYDKARSNVSLRGRLEKESSLDKNGGDSISALMSEEYADEAEFASLTDDDVSTHSSLTYALDSNGGSPSQYKENGAGQGKDLPGGETGKSVLDPKLAHKTPDPRSYGESIDNLIEESLRASSVKVSSVHRTVENASGSLSDYSDLESDSNSNHLTSGTKANTFLPRSDEGTSSTMTSIVHADAPADQDSENESKPASFNAFKQVKSVRSQMESARSNGSSDGGRGISMKQEAKIYQADKGSISANTKVKELEDRIKLLEGELREAAAVEVALYSVVAEHGSSMNKVHAPARRLSRLYIQASIAMRRASAAQSAVSGLIVVAKACGNDVPRLTFWLSNCIVLRAIISMAFAEGDLPISAGPSAERNGFKGKDTRASALKWKVSPTGKKLDNDTLQASFEHLEVPQAFLYALEKVESWIFSRIVESVWWQTLTPHMQSSAAKAIDKVVDSGSKKSYKRSSSSADQGQVNVSLELWKKAFKDACERLCPVRAGGHECGCLPVLAKLIMEQCVARLDVAMFNAILRESAEDIPTDPVSDPISDAKVLPIPAGKSSFGAGALLKNAIGNWSRWLTDLFGMDDDDDAPEDERDDIADDCHKHDSSFKSFHLLKSLSDLMMLPKDMLLSESVRREVCPAFGAPLVKRVLETFVPDEFCPDPIPDAVFEALDSADILLDEEQSIMHVPCAAPAVFYFPPPASSLASIIDGGSMGTGSQPQLRRSSSVLRRSNTSDDELDDLDSPFNLIIGDSLLASTRTKPNPKAPKSRNKNAVRYQLLRQVWGQ